MNESQCMDLIVKAYTKKLNKMPFIHQHYSSRILSFGKVIWKGYQQVSYIWASGTSFTLAISQKSHMTSIFLVETNIK